MVWHTDLLYYSISHFLALASLCKLYKVLRGLFHSALNYSHFHVSYCQQLIPSSLHRNNGTYYTSNRTLIRKLYLKDAWYWLLILVQEKIYQYWMSYEILFLFIKLIYNNFLCPRDNIPITSYRQTTEREREEREFNFSVLSFLTTVIFIKHYIFKSKCLHKYK